MVHTGAVDLSNAAGRSPSDSAWLSRIRRGASLKLGVVVAALICFAAVTACRMLADRFAADGAAADRDFWNAVGAGKKGDGGVEVADRVDGKPPGMEIDVRNVDRAALNDASGRMDRSLSALLVVRAVLVVLLLISAGLLILMARAAFLISTPEPNPWSGRRRPRWRLAVRSAAVLAVLGWLPAMVLMIVAPEQSRQPIRLASTALTVILFTGEVIFLADVARHLGDSRLVNQVARVQTLLDRIPWIVLAALVAVWILKPGRVVTVPLTAGLAALFLYTLVLYLAMLRRVARAIA